jgi:hypothetical protein
VPDPLRAGNRSHCDVRNRGRQSTNHALCNDFHALSHAPEIPSKSFEIRDSVCERNRQTSCITNERTRKLHDEGSTCATQSGARDDFDVRAADPGLGLTVGSPVLGAPAGPVTSTTRRETARAMRGCPAGNPPRTQFRAKRLSTLHGHTALTGAGGNPYSLGASVADNSNPHRGAARTRLSCSDGAALTQEIPPRSSCEPHRATLPVPGTGSGRHSGWRSPGT